MKKRNNQAKKAPPSLGCKQKKDLPGLMVQNIRKGGKKAASTSKSNDAGKSTIKNSREGRKRAASNAIVTPGTNKRPRTTAAKDNQQEQGCFHYKMVETKPPSSFLSRHFENRFLTDVRNLDTPYPPEATIEHVR